MCGLLCTLCLAQPHTSLSAQVVPAPLGLVDLEAQNPMSWQPRSHQQVDLRWFLMCATLSTSLQLVYADVTHCLQRQNTQQVRATVKPGIEGVWRTLQPLYIPAMAKLLV